MVATTLRRIGNGLKQVMDIPLEMKYEHYCLLSEFRQYVMDELSKYRKIEVIVLYTNDPESIRSKIKIENSILGTKIRIKSFMLNGKDIADFELRSFRGPSKKRTIYALAMSKENGKIYDTDLIGAIKNSSGLDIVQVRV